MRVSRDEAARNRTKVVEAAAEKFRQRGYDGIGVVGLMEAAGLTHGGFYKQFADKEALVVEATEQALAENLGNWGEAIAKAPGDPLGTLRQWYLSKEHIDRVGDGCAYAALAAEAPRHGAALQQVFEDAFEESIARLVPDDDGSKDARAEAIRGMAQMVGSLVLARAVRRRELAEEILKSGKKTR
ncbi:TetR/AcrR family transcriptional regulator [Sphingopyxis chilensis]|uniref:TetR/AcrR family transcriptional regulator n=1 Tax=Sphingopyxis chilensis TaxID=180400 RepID=UPI002DDD93B1|nr:TetR/AcrR family transcriptional regulator [Sphingopyxis chilensis]